MKRFISLNLIDAELQITVFYTETSISNCFTPLSNIIEKSFRGCNTFPCTVGIAGPPGSGKSTIALTLSSLLKEKNLNSEILPLDGFHLNNDVLKSRKLRRGKEEVSLYEIKGAKETYDVNAFLSHLRKLKNKDEFYWPVYSRKLHQPIQKGIKIADRKKVFIIEGNYLFLNLSPWNKTIDYIDIGIFINPITRFLKKRIIERKVMGGIARCEAKRHYKIADRLNIKEVLQKSSGFDYLIRQESKYEYILHSARK